MSRNPSLPIAVPALHGQDTQTPLLWQLSIGLRQLKQRIALLPEPHSCCVLFFTVSAQGTQDGVFFVRRATLEAAWREGATRVRQWAWMRRLSAVELRVEWPTEIVTIGQRVPPLWEWGPASGWALADGGLEHAELLPPVALASGDRNCLETRLKSCAATARLLELAEVNLLLRLQGLQVDQNGAHAELPPSPLP